MYTQTSLLLFLFLNNEAHINESGLSWTSPERLAVSDQHMNRHMVEQQGHRSRSDSAPHRSAILSQSTPWASVVSGSL